MFFNTAFFGRVTQGIKKRPAERFKRNRRSVSFVFSGRGKSALFKVFRTALGAFALCAFRNVFYSSVFTQSFHDNFTAAAAKEFMGSHCRTGVLTGCSCHKCLHNYKSRLNIPLFSILVNRFGIALPCAIPNPSFSPKNSHTYNLSAVRGGYMRQHLPCAILPDCSLHCIPFFYIQLHFLQ